MKKQTLAWSAMLMISLNFSLGANGLSLESAPPVVVKTSPVAGSAEVDPATAELRVTFSKDMQDGTWSWSTWGKENFPEMTGQPRYESDGRTCVLPVKLEPGKFYATWLNSERFQNFKDRNGLPAVPYLLTFNTSSSAGAATKPAEFSEQVETVLKDPVKRVAELLDLDTGNLATNTSFGENDRETHAWIRANHLDLLGAVKGGQVALLGMDMAVLPVNSNLWQQSTPADITSNKQLAQMEPDKIVVMSTAVDNTDTFIFRTREGGHGILQILGENADPRGVKIRYKATGSSSGTANLRRTDPEELLNENQRAFLAWTDRQFRGFFDARSFAGWSEEERTRLEERLIDSLNGPRSREYYQAINTLAALKSEKALPRLREIAFERVDRNNRDRWMAVRALGLMGDKEAIPQLVHLVYHGNVNTRWWAQISLVRLTDQNFATDWKAWGNWWNNQNGQPPYQSDIIRWWDGQPPEENLAESLKEDDRKFFESLKPQSSAAPEATPKDEAARLQDASEVMNGIRDAWSAAVTQVRRGEVAEALASVKVLAPRIEEFRKRMEGTSFEPGAREALRTLQPLLSALEKGDLEAARSALDPMMALGATMEEQVKRVQETSSTPELSPVPGLVEPLILQRDNGVKQGVQSIAASGKAVDFERPGKARFIEAVHMFASRYGTPEAPAENFNLYLLNAQNQVLANLEYPYSLIARGDAAWYTLRTPSIEVPEKFKVVLNFNAHRTKGVYLAYSPTNGVACYSSVGLPGDGFEFWKPVEWMVRVSLSAEPTKEKGFQALADWTPAVETDPFANCRMVAFGGDKSDAKQSYGGQGPAISFKPAKVLPGPAAGQALSLRGLRLYASRYGSGYSPEETKLRVVVRDSQEQVLAEAFFPYGRFGYRAGWVDLAFEKPVPIASPEETLTVVFDPDANQYKGIYFFYEKDPPQSHSFVGNLKGPLKQLPDREWLVRACFQ